MLKREMKKLAVSIAKLAQGKRRKICLVMKQARRLRRIKLPALNLEAYTELNVSDLFQGRLCT
jgi:predicted amino acid dehydrogenase